MMGNTGCVRANASNDAGDLFAFSFLDTDLDIAETDVLLIRTGNRPLAVFTTATCTTGRLTALWAESPTVTAAGTEIAVYSMNRTKAKAAPIHVYSGGTLVGGAQCAPTTTYICTSVNVPMTYRNDDCTAAPLILKPNTDYSITLNSSADNMVMNLNFSVHVL
jgi:hypothetical protein